jgi:MFS superfamily sulfate permease-like transporter
MINQHGVGMLGAIVLTAGLIQIGMAALKAGPWFRAISPAVIQGMLAGIGVLIIGSQIHVMVDDAPKGVEAIQAARRRAEGLSHTG